MTVSIDITYLTVAYPTLTLTLWPGHVQPNANAEAGFPAQSTANAAEAISRNPQTHDCVIRIDTEQ